MPQKSLPEIAKIVGLQDGHSLHHYSLRNWIEYGFKQVKNELGWADFRLTDYESIERWWEIIFSAYLLVSIQSTYFQLEAEKPVAENLPNSSTDSSSFINASTTEFRQHREWEPGMTWKSSLNNLRLIVQPYIFYHLLLPCLDVFNIPGMRRCFLKLIELMNGFRASPILFSIAS